MGISLIVAFGRIVIRARAYKSSGFTVDDGFFLLAVATYLAATVLTYIDTSHMYTQQEVIAGLRFPPPNFLSQIITNEKFTDATTSLLGASIVSVKFSFLFFFRALLRRQKKMMVWWWCIFAIMIPTAVVMVFAFLIICASWNQDIFGKQTSCSARADHHEGFTDAFEVKCVTPAANLRQNGVLKSVTTLDIFTDVLRKSWHSRWAELALMLTNQPVMTVPVILLWNVRISVRRKLALGGILCLSICTIITSIIRLAGGTATNGELDQSWVIFWYDIEAAIAIIIVSVTAFRALFVAHQAMKYRSPGEKGSTSWNFWSKKSKSSRGKEQPETPPPALGGVRTQIRGSQYGGSSFNRVPDDLELPLHGPFITVTQVVQTEKVGGDFLFQKKQKS